MAKGIFFRRHGNVGLGKSNPDKELDIAGSLNVDGTLTASNLSGTIAGTNTGDVTLTAVGSSPSANGATLAGQALTLQPASGTQPGLLTAGAQTIGGAKTFSSTISASNLSGTNTGDVTLAAVGSSPNANGASLSGQALNLQPADASNPGVITTGTQTIAGNKTFSGIVAASGNYFQSTSGYAAAGVAPSTQGLFFFSGTVIARVPTDSDAIVLSSTSSLRFGTFSRSGLDLNASADTNARITYSYSDSSGTPGSATIDKPSGRSAIAAAASAATITCNACTTTSIVSLTPEDLDATLTSYKVVPGNGSFVVTGNAAATGTWKFRWVLDNGV